MGEFGSFVRFEVLRGKKKRRRRRRVVCGMFWTEVLRGKEKEEGELWNVLDRNAGMVGNKRGKKEKKKRKEGELSVDCFGLKC